MRTQTQVNGILSPYLQEIRFKKALPHIVGNRILDVGCSHGEILRHLSDEIDYIGVEGNPVYCAYAKTLNPRHTFLNLYLDGHNSGSLKIPERNTILMLAVLEHLKKPLETVINLKAYLSRNGRIIITTPTNYAEYILKVGSKLKIFSSEMHEHKNHFSKRELLSIVNRAAMRIVHYSNFELGMNQLVVLKN